MGNMKVVHPKLFLTLIINYYYYYYYYYYYIVIVFNGHWLVMNKE